MLLSSHKGIELGFKYTTVVPYSHNSIQSFIEFCIDKLKLTANMFKRLMFNFEHHEDECGNFQYEHDRGTTTVHRLEDLHVIRTVLAHELIHAQQWGTRLLRYDYEKTKEGIKRHIVWDGKRVDHQTLEYHELPWEIDAHERQSQLTSQFVVENFSFA